MTSSAPPQQPEEWLQLEDIEIGHTNDATRRLADGIVRRTFTDPQQVTDLIQDGADPNSAARLRVRGSGGHGRPYRLLSLAIDNLSDGTLQTTQASLYSRRPLFLPHWSSPELEADILNALIDGGAHVNEPTSTDDRPIRMAICGGNESAVTVLLAPSAAVHDDHGLGMELPRSVTGRIVYQVSPGYEQRLLSIDVPAAHRS